MKTSFFVRSCVSWFLRLPLIRIPLIYGSDEWWVRHQFDIGSEYETREFLLELVDCLSEGASESAPREQVLGDALHWLGHFSETEGDAYSARRYFESAYEHYSRIENDYSPKLNGLSGRMHARDHLDRMRSRAS